MQKSFFISRLRRAPMARGMFFFRSNGFALRAGAPAAWGRFFLSVKWLCAPRGPERRAGFFFELVLAPVARGRFSFSVKWLCAPRGPEVGRGDSKHPSLSLARAERKPFDRKRKLPRATSARTYSKKKTALRSGPRGAQSHLTKRKNLPRAAGAPARSA